MVRRESSNLRTNTCIAASSLQTPVGIGTKQKSVMVLTNSQLLDLVLETNSFTAF